MEEFTPYPVADQEEARPPLFLDQTEARDRPPCLRVWMIAPLAPPLSEGLQPNPQPTVLADFPPYPTPQQTVPPDVPPYPTPNLKS